MVFMNKVFGVYYDYMNIYDLIMGEKFGKVSNQYGFYFSFKLPINHTFFYSSNELLYWMVYYKPYTSNNSRPNEFN